MLSAVVSLCFLLLAQCFFYLATFVPSSAVSCFVFRNFLLLVLNFPILHTESQQEATNHHPEPHKLTTLPTDELHLTRVDGVVQMRPQFHHVDAITHAETAARRTEAAEGNGPSGPGAAAAAAKQPQALALAQTYKDNRDVENLEALRAKNLLLIAAEEKWTRLEYFDEDEEASYETYHDRLFLKEPGAAPPLKSQMKNEEYLDAISAPRVDPSGRKKKRPLTKKQMERIEAAEDDVEGSGEMGGEVEVEMA